MANVGKTVWSVVLASLAGSLTMLAVDRVLGFDRSSSPTVTAATASRPTGFSVPSTKPMRSRFSKYWKP